MKVGGGMGPVTTGDGNREVSPKLASLRAAIQRGLNDVAAGRVIDGDEAFAKLAAKHFPHRVA
jgi:hypothetical protein